MVCQEMIYHIKKTTVQTIKTTLAGVVFCCSEFVFFGR